MLSLHVPVCMQRLLLLIGLIIMSIEVLLKIEGSREELSVNMDNVAFVIEEELGQLGIDGRITIIIQ